MRLRPPAVLTVVLAILAGALAGCRHAPPPTTAPADAVPTDAPPPVLLGGDRDAHDCIGSAGYTWCEREATCVRPWELAAAKRLANSADAFDAYCAGSSR